MRKKQVRQEGGSLERPIKKTCCEWIRKLRPSEERERERGRERGREREGGRGRERDDIVEAW